MEDEYYLELRILDLEEKLKNKKTRLDYKFQEVREEELKMLKEQLEYQKYYNKKWENNDYGM